MPGRPIEYLPYSGESPQDRKAFAQYMEEVKRGKSLLALVAMRDALTPEIRKCWFVGTFGTIETSEGVFDAPHMQPFIPFRGAWTALWNNCEYDESRQAVF